MSSFWAFFIAIAQNVPSDCSQKFAGLQDSQKKNFLKGFQEQFKQRTIGNHNPESCFFKCVRFLGIFHCYRPECAIWLFPKICGTPGFTEKKTFFERVQKQFKQRNIGNHNPETCFCQMCQVFGHFSLLSPRMCHLIVPKNLLDSRIHRKNVFFERVQKQFKQRTIGNHNPESGFRHKCWIFWAFFIAIAQNVSSDCSQKFAGLQDSQKKHFFWKGFKSNLNKEPLATTILNPVFVTSVGFFWHFSLLSPRMCHLIVPRNCGTAGFTEKKWKFQNQFKQRTLDNHNPESSFCQMCQVFVHFSLLSPRMRHLIVPKKCGTPGFTEKYVFWKGFKSNLNKEPLATTILNPVFVKCVRFLGIFHYYRPECAIWLFPKIGVLQDSQKIRFLKRFPKQFKQRTIGNHNPESSFCQMCQVFGHFSLLSPRMCHLIIPKHLRDSRTHRKNVFLKGFQKQFKQRTIGNHNPESNFQMCQVFVHFSLLSPTMCHLIVPKNWGAPGFTEKKTFFERVSKAI